MSKTPPRHGDGDEARDAGTLVFGKVVTVIAEAAMPFLIVRLLAKADVGAFAGILLIYTTLATLLTAGFPKTVLYYLANRDLAQRAAIIRRLLSILLVLGFVVGGLMVLIGEQGNAFLTWAQSLWEAGPHQDAEAMDLSYLTIFCLYPLFDIPVRIFPTLLIAEKRARGAATYSVLHGANVSISTLLPAALGFGVTGIIVGRTVAAAIEFVAVQWSIRAIYRPAPRIPADVDVRSMFSFSAPIGATDIVSTLNANVDRYLILLFMSVLALAEYRAGAWQLPVAFIAYSVGDVYMPRFKREFVAGRPQVVIDLWRQSIQKVSLIVVPICAIFLVAGDAFVRLAFTEDYAAATPVFQLYVVYTMARVASFGSLIVVSGDSKPLLKAALFTLLSNIVISVPLTLWLGFVGPALGTALAFIPTVAVYCYYIAQALGLSIRDTFPLLDWLKVVGVALLCCAPAAVLIQTIALPHLVTLLVTALSCLPLFVLLSRRFGLMSAEDLDYARSWLQLKFLRADP